MQRYLRIAVLVLAVLSTVYVAKYVIGVNQQDIETAVQSDDFPLKRSGHQLILTKHARCRMECRQIEEREIHEILATGTYNPAKSDPKGTPDPKYALEGKTSDNQMVRVIFADAPNGLVVVTVIDLDTDWACSCN